MSFKKDKINSNLGEELVRWYLRFNGYFTIDNFIVHNSERSKNNVIGNSSEIDLLAVRFCNSKEYINDFQIINDKNLLNGIKSKVDLVIAEVKTGNTAKLNTTWKKDKSIFKYVLNFAGLFESDEEIDHCIDDLFIKNSYDSANDLSVRVILFSQEPISKQNKTLKNITFDEIFKFLINDRGDCWNNQGIGISSLHNQWDGFINEIFKIANSQMLNSEQKIIEMYKIMSNPD